MEPDFQTRMVLTLAAVAAVMWLVKLGIALPKLGMFMLIFVWVLGCSIVAARWDLPVGWVLGGSIGALILLGGVLLLCLVLHDRWNNGR